MSLNGSGRFLRRYDPRASFDSREGDQENPRVNFEPGSGAEFMYNAGWHNRDPYGNEIKVTPKRGGYDSYDEEESSSGMKFWLIIALGIVTLLLIILALVMAVLFGTRVFIVNPGEQVDPTPRPTLGPYDPVIKRTFTCEMIILNQADPAYNNKNSPEYERARIMISNATAIMIDQSSLKQLQGYVTFDRIQNIVENLKYYFKLTITVPSRNPINAIDVRRIIFPALAHSRTR